MGLILKMSLLVLELGEPSPHCKFQRINKRMGNRLSDGRAKTQHSTTWETQCKLPSAHLEQIHVLRTTENLSLGAEGDPIQGKDTVWLGWKCGNKCWSLLRGGSREAALVWLSCLGDAPPSHSSLTPLPCLCLAKLWQTLLWASLIGFLCSWFCVTLAKTVCSKNSKVIKILHGFLCHNGLLRVCSGSRKKPNAPAVLYL